MNRIKILVVSLSLLWGMETKAQTFDEVFNQRKTQIKYLMEQIAALQVQIGYVQKGYAIAKDGLGFIGRTTKGELELHDAFFQSLKHINPEVSHYPRVKEIGQLYKAVLQSQRSYTQTFGQVAELSMEEKEYVKTVLKRILDDCFEANEMLETVLRAGKLEMKDDERIKRINQLYERMLENYLINISFSAGTMKLVRARLAGKTELINSGKLNR